MTGSSSHSDSPPLTQLARTASCARKHASRSTPLVARESYASVPTWSYKNLFCFASLDICLRLWLRRAVRPLLDLCTPHVHSACAHHMRTPHVHTAPWCRHAERVCHPCLRCAQAFQETTITYVFPDYHKCVPWPLHMCAGI